MDLKNLFNNWAKDTNLKYQGQQWLLSKWDILDGVKWPYHKVDILMGHIRTYLDFHPETNGRFLDVGCGGGWILDQFGGLMQLSVGYDIAFEMLKNSSKKHPLINGDACFLSFKDESFDRVLCYFVFINIQDFMVIDQALSEIVRVLKPGGKALIGQLPDQEKSQIYDHEKKRYLKYCEENFSISANNRDVHHIPIQLFNRDFFQQTITRFGCNVTILPAFNPFYRAGEAERITWRFDVVVEKNKNENT